MTLPPSIEDRLELLALPSRYVHLVDEERWDRLDVVFTADVRCDYRDFVPSLEPLDGLAAVQARFASVDQPLSHHTTDVLLVRAPEPDRCEIRSKVLVVGRDRRPYVGCYLDDAVRTDDGWRIAVRTARRARGLAR